MSVLRPGGSLLHRSLSKLYSDTKQSYESITKAPRVGEDPELIDLNRNFRSQKDRLLAWGLQWSDTAPTPSHDVDIDESLKRAGLGEIVTNVMSTIQRLLDEAQQMQNPQSRLAPLREKGGFSSPIGRENGQIKSAWTDAENSRLKELLVQLTACIDTLCDLSNSRRSIKSASKTTKIPQPFPSPGAQDAVRSLQAPRRPKGHAFEFGDPASPQNEDVEQFLIQSNAAIHPLYLDRNALDLASGEVTHAYNPPPYELAAASSLNTRLIGSIKSSAVSPDYRRAGSDEHSWMPVLVEFTPALAFKTAAVLPSYQRLEDVAGKLRRLVQEARTCHTGFLQFLGDFIDLACSQYAFVYHLPVRAGYQIPRDIGVAYAQPKTLFAILPSDDGVMDAPMPSLEDRYRLAYNLVVAMLQLRDRNLVHGTVNSSNIVFLRTNDTPASKQDRIIEDIRNPYLISFGQLSDDGLRPSPEPLSACVYRHPQDRRSMEDRSAWTYDLYSLGLVLLEIGLWTPLNRLWKSKYDQTVFKSRLENVYAKKLAAKCGSLYMNVVKSCLAAPDSSSTYMQPSMNLNEGFHFARKYVYSLAKDISRCCAIDYCGSPVGPDLDTFDELEPTFPVEQRQGIDVTAPAASESSPQNTAPLDKPPLSQPLEERRSKDDSELFPGQEVKGQRRALKKFNHLDLPQKCLDDWNTTIMPRLSKLLQKILKDSSESSSASLMMVGETAEAAKPTICVTCSSVGKVRGALRRYLDHDRDVWGLIVLRGEVQRSKVPRKKKRRPRKPRAGAGPEPKDLNPHYQEKPSCGASIGAYRYGEHYPPVSYGGVIVVDGQPFGMTVHHMLDAPSDDDETEEAEEYDTVQRCAATWDHGNATIAEDVAFSWSWDATINQPLTLEISDDEDDEESSLFESGYYDHEFEGYAYEEDETADEADDTSVGDIAGIDPDDDEELVITQPALDDVEEGFYPNAEDRNDEHLCFSVGSIHASSGIRRQRCRESGVKHEIDWALIKMSDERLRTQNLIPQHALSSSAHGGTTADTKPKFASDGDQGSALIGVTNAADLGGLEVACCGRTSGLRMGRISKAMTLVRMSGRRSFSHSWCVDGGFGIPGDSGAWIYDAEEHELCGHVLAWSTQTQTAFMAPMQIMFDDIRRTLSAANVMLPDSEEGVLQSGADKAQTTERATQPPSSGPAALAVDLSCLSISANGSDTSRGSSVPKGVATVYRGRSSMMVPSPNREAQMV